MRVRGLWPKYGLMLASLAAGATTLATPASAEFFFRPFFGSFVERIEVDPWPAIAPRRVVAILARRGFRLAQPPYYGDDEIVAIGVDERGGHTRFVLDPEDGEVLERRRIDRGRAPAHVAARHKPAIHSAAYPTPRHEARPQAPSPKRADPSAPPKAMERPHADAVRPAAPHVPPTPPVTTPAAPAAAATPPIHPTAPAPDKAPAAASEAPQSPAAAAPAPAAPAANWKAPSE